MNKNEDFDKIDKELLEYFEIKKKLEHSHSTEYAIKNAFNQKNESKQSSINFIPKFAIYIFSILFLTTGVVFAKDIINILSNFFTNTTQSIDTAIENGYVQNLDMDYVYDNNIGIKVNFITLDESNMDISYSYKLNKSIPLDYIELYNYQIKDENDNIVYKYDKENTFSEIKQIVNYIKNDNKIIRVKDNIYNTSILYGSNKFPNMESLFIDVRSLRVNYDEIINGNWSFCIKLDNKFNQRENIIYESEYSEYITNNNIYLSETVLKIELEINKILDDNLVFSNKPILTDVLGNTYNCIAIDTMKKDNETIYNLEFDISKYNENINCLYLKLKIDKNEEITLKLNKVE